MDKHAAVKKAVLGGDTAFALPPENFAGPGGPAAWAGP